MTEQTTVVDEQVKWVIDPLHSEIQFKVKHMMISTVTGNFTKFDADIVMSGDDLATAKVEFRADVDSITTNHAQRDAHLKGTDFLSGEKHPVIRFVKTGAKPMDRNGHWTMHGELNMNGATHPVELSVEWGGIMKDPHGNTKAGVSIQGKVDRKKWGINWNAALEAGGVLVSDEVRIACEVQLVKQG